MSSQRSTCSATCPSSGATAGSTRRHDAEHDAVSRPPAPRRACRGRRPTSWPGPPTGPGHRRRAAGRAACRPQHAWTHGSAPALGDRLEDPAQGVEASGGSTLRCRWKPDAVGTLPASTAASAGSSTCTTSRSTPRSRRRTSATWSRESLGQRLGQLASGADVAEDLVAARLLDRGRQRPRTGDLDLERRPRMSCACSSSRSRSWASRLRARRWSTPGASVSRQPAGCRSAPSSLTMARARPVMVAPAPRPGSSGRWGRSGSSPSTVRTASAYAASSSPGIDPTPVATVTRSPGRADPLRRADRRRPDDPGAVVDHRGLAGRDALGRVEQLDRRPRRRRTETTARCSLAVRPQLDGALEPRRDRAAPARPDAGDPVDGQPGRGARR